MAIDRTRTYKDIPLPPATEGLILETSLSHYVAPEGSFSLLENFHNDTLGQTTSRRPLVNRSVITSGIAAAVLGCTLYQSPAGSTYVVWQEGTSMKLSPVDNTGSVTTHATSLSTSRSRYDVVQGYLLATQTAGTQPKYFNDTGAPVALGTSFPVGGVNLISAGFTGRIWCASDIEPSTKLYYSDVIPVGGVTGTTGGASFITINANNADKITGLIRTQNVLYVFTHNGIFRVYNTQSADNAPIAPIGAFSQEGIVQAKDGYYFYHPSGIFKLQGDGTPVEISQRIRGLVQSVPTIFQSSVFGWSDEDHVYFNLGSTVQGYDTNKSWVVRYTISTQVWTTYSFYDQDLRCVAYGNFAGSTGGGSSEDIYPTNFLFVNQLSSATNRYGCTFNMFIPSTENSAVVQDLNAYPIFIKQVSHWNIFGMEAHYKRINGIAMPHDNAGGLQLSYIADKESGNTFKPIGTLNDNYVTLFQDFQSDAFNRIKIQIAGTSTASVRVGRSIIIVLDDLGYKTQ